MFEVEKFIRESNLIDVQHDEKGILIPGSSPGDKMYDNQLKALEIIPALKAVHPTPNYLPLVIHRELTRGISIYEDRGDSGAYRRCDVWIGGEKAPPVIIAERIIKEILTPEIEIWRKKENLSPEEAIKFAWWCHDLFECAHPFIDGNGRTGRLLLNTVLEFLGQEKIIVWFDKRWEYYQKIREFRMNEFPDIVKKHLEIEI